MDAVSRGGDRQELHEIIRQYSQEAAKAVKAEGKENKWNMMLPLITLIGGIPVEVLHQCPHGGEHVFRHALAIRAARIGDHGAARQHTRADVRIHTGAEGLQPFKTGVLGSLRDRKVADDCGSSGAKLLGNSGRPDHVAAVRFVAHEFLRHIASRLGESPPFSFVEWQAVDNQLMRVLNTHGSPN